MMLKIKRCLSLLLVFLLVISFSVTLVYAKESQFLTREDILAMNKSELLSTLKDKGLLLPEDYATHIELAEKFVYKYTPMILSGKIDTSIMLFNYDQSNEMLSNLSTILCDLGLTTSRMISARSNYTLQNSTPMVRGIILI